MSKVEIMAIVIVVAIPIIALIIMNPFKNIIKRKNKTKGNESITASPDRKEVAKQGDEKVIKANDVINDVFETEPFKMSEVEDYKEYAKKKQKDFIPPEFKSANSETTTYDDFKSSLQEQKLPKVIIKEIKQLSPELKALLFTGALSDKKYED